MERLAGQADPTACAEAALPALVDLLKQFANPEGQAAAAWTLAELAGTASLRRQVAGMSFVVMSCCRAMQVIIGCQICTLHPKNEPELDFWGQTQDPKPCQRS